MSHRANCYDNVMMESFCGTLKAECIVRYLASPSIFHEPTSPRPAKWRSLVQIPGICGKRKSDENLQLKGECCGHTILKKVEFTAKFTAI
jgi:transposase InsO family protein